MAIEKQEPPKGLLATRGVGEAEQCNPGWPIFAARKEGQARRMGSAAIIANSAHYPVPQLSQVDYRQFSIPSPVLNWYVFGMADQFEMIQERIEGILVLLKTTKNFKGRSRLLCDLRVQLDEADRVLIDEPGLKP